MAFEEGGSGKVRVYKGKRTSGCWLLLIPVLMICLGIPLCIGVITVGIVTGVVKEQEVKTVQLGIPGQQGFPTGGATSGQFDSSLEGTEAGIVEILAGVADVRINPHSIASAFSADIAYVGEVDFSAGGDATKTFRLRQVTDTQNSLIGLLNIFNIQSRDELVWNIGLSREIPYTLQVTGGLGAVTMDLREIALNAVSVTVGVGEINLQLPETRDTSYRVAVTGGIGRVNLTLPESSAVRLEVNSVVEISLPERFRRVDSGGSANQGIWESEGFSSADYAITIVYNGGLGQLTVR